MDPSTWFDSLLSLQNPLLPGAMAMRVAMRGAWAIVLASFTLLLFAGRLAPRHRARLSLLVGLWTLLPGELSPAYWLGLAFQTPSLTSVLVCLVWLARCWRQQAQLALSAGRPGRAQAAGAAAAIVLGWVLLLDALAWLPISLYAWGFSPLALGGAALAAALFWAFAGRTRAGNQPGFSWLAALPLLVLTLFVLTRLPSGNLWDALIDPWLWLVLQWRCLLSVARRIGRTLRLSAATRA
jgi:hypothetical protein